MMFWKLMRQSSVKYDKFLIFNAPEKKKVLKTNKTLFQTLGKLYKSE